MSQFTPSSAILERIQKWEKEKRRILGPNSTREHIAALLPPRGTYAAARICFLEDLVTTMQREWAALQQQQQQQLAGTTPTARPPPPLPHSSQSSQHGHWQQTRANCPPDYAVGPAADGAAAEFLSEQAADDAAALGQIVASHAEASGAAERLQQELLDARREGAAEVGHVTRSFEAVARRAAARHEEQLRQLRRDAARHRARADGLQAVVEQREGLEGADRAAAAAEAAEAASAAEAAAAELRQELAAVREGRRRSDEAAEAARQRLHRATAAGGHLAEVAAQLRRGSRASKRRHKAAVEALLAVAEGLAPHERPAADETIADGSPDGCDRSDDELSEAAAMFGGDGGGDATLNCTTASSAAAAAAVAAAGPSAPPSEAVRQQSARLLRELTEQRAELAVAVEVATEAVHRREVERRGRVRDSHAFAELLTARVQELEQQVGEQHDAMLRERDQAANERDHALALLRTHDGRRARLVRHVEVQTAFQ